MEAGSKRGRLADETPGTRRVLAEYRQEVWGFTDRLFLWLLARRNRSGQNTGTVLYNLMGICRPLLVEQLEG